MPTDPAQYPALVQHNYCTRIGFENVAFILRIQPLQNTVYANNIVVISMHIGM